MRYWNAIWHIDSGNSTYADIVSASNVELANHSNQDFAVCFLDQLLIYRVSIRQKNQSSQKPNMTEFYPKARLTLVRWLLLQNSASMSA